MHVAPRRVPRRSTQGDDLALFHGIAHPGHEHGVVAIAGADGIAVVKGDAHPGMSGPGGNDDKSIGRSIHRRTAAYPIILSNMRLEPGPCRILPPTESTGDESSGHWVDKLDLARQHPLGRGLWSVDAVGRLGVHDAVPNTFPSRSARHCGFRQSRCNQDDAWWGTAHVQPVPGDGTASALESHIYRFHCPPCIRRRSHGIKAELICLQCRSCGWCHRHGKSHAPGCHAGALAGSRLSVGRAINAVRMLLLHRATPPKICSNRAARSDGADPDPPLGLERRVVSTVTPITGRLGTTLTQKSHCEKGHIF